MSDADYQRTYAQTSRERQREYDDERDAEIAALADRAFVVSEAPERRYSLAEMIAANDDPEDLHRWLRTCPVGARFVGINTVERVA